MARAPVARRAHYLIEAPVAFATARSASPRDGSVLVICRFGELATDYALTPEFTHRHKVATVFPMIPFVTPADVTLQTGGIDAEGIGLVLAVHILRNCVAQHTAEYRAAHYRCAVPMAGG